MSVTKDFSQLDLHCWVGKTIFDQGLISWESTGRNGGQILSFEVLDKFVVLIYCFLFGEDCYCQIYVHIQNNENKDSKVCVQHFTLKEITKSTPISNVGVIRNSSRPTSKPLMFFPLTL